MKRVIAFLLALGMTACAAPIKQVWVRTDGQRLASSPVLQSQFEVDRTVCEGDTQKANMAGTQFCRGVIDCAAAASVRSDQMKSVARGCMADRGYLLVNEEDADQKIADLAAIQKQKEQPPPRQAKR